VAVPLTIETEDARGGRAAVGADWVVVALPASTLRDVGFSPTLLDRQREAIAHLHYRAMAEASVQLGRPFWAAAGCPRAYGSGMEHAAVWDANEGQRGRSGIPRCSPADGRAARCASGSRDGVGAVREPTM
jgi:monoamine oxidase